MNPLSAENFVDSAGHLTFFPWFGMDRTLFRGTLRDPTNPELRSLLIAATLESLRPDDALAFVRFHEILEDWPSIEGRLVSSRPLWGWIMETAGEKLPGLCQASPPLPRDPSLILRCGPEGDLRRRGRVFFDERLACELARFWSEPKVPAVAGIRYLYERGACLDAALRRAPEFAPEFSPFELAFELAHLGSWAELKSSQHTVVALLEFVESLVLRLLELCLEEAVLSPDGEIAGARPPV